MDGAVAHPAVQLDTAEKAAALEQLVDRYGDGVLQLDYLYLKDRRLRSWSFRRVLLLGEDWLSRWQSPGDPHPDRGTAGKVEAAG